MDSNRIAPEVVARSLSLDQPLLPRLLPRQTKSVLRSVIYQDFRPNISCSAESPQLHAFLGAYALLRVYAPRSSRHGGRGEDASRSAHRPSGGRRIASIDWLEVELFVSSLIERGLGPKTCRDAASVLSLIMKSAQRAKVIRENPASGHSIPVRRRRAPVLTMEQVH